MNKLTILSATLLIGVSANAETWTLDSCINYATSHNLTVLSRELQTKSAEYDITEAKDRYLPSVNASAGESWSFGRGLTSENTYANRNTSTFNWGVNMTLPLFQGLSAVRQVNYAKAYYAQVLEEVESAKDDITLNVMAAYLQALYCREMVEVAHEQVRISGVELERRKGLLDAGKIAELEVIQAESQLATDKVTEVNADNDLKIALLDLSQLLRLPDSKGFDIAPLADSDLPVYSPDQVLTNALRHNHSIVASELSIQTAKRAIELAKTGYIPRLSFNAGVGSSYYHLNGEINPPFGRQMRDNYATSIGFSLSIPIFDAFSTRNQVRKAKLQQLNAELERETRVDALTRAIQQAYTQAVGAEHKYSASVTARNAAKAAFDAMQEKYNLGRANSTEFEQAKSTYIKSVSEQVQSKYESILRRRILEFYNK